MDNVEERVAFLEGKAEVQGEMINDIREIAARLERRFDQLEQRLDQRFTTNDQRFDNLDSKVSRHFVVLVSLLVTMLVAIVGGLSGVIAAILQESAA